MSQATLSCVEDILTVTWPTDVRVTYKASVSKIPDTMVQRVANRSKDAQKILKMTFADMKPR